MPFLQRLFSLLCVLMPLTLWAQTPTLSFQQLGIAQGLPSSHCTGIIQDNQGFMWFATTNGLSRFDGTRWVQYIHEVNKNNSLSHSLLRSITKTKDGTIWVGTQRGLNRFDKTTGSFKRYFFTHLNEACNHIRAIAEDANGILWLGTKNSVVRFDPLTEKSELIALPTDEISKPSVYNIRCLLADGETLWIGTQLGLYAYNRRTRAFKALCKSDEIGSLPDNYVSTLAKNPKTGEILVGTRDGLLLVLHQSTETFGRMPLQLEQNQAITSIFFTNEGTLWVATQDGGLLRLLHSQNRFVNYISNDKDPMSICSNSLTQIFQDRGGVLWIASRDAGTSRCNPFVTKFNDLFSEIGYLPPASLGLSVPVMEFDKQHNLWVATYDGLLQVGSQRNTFKVFKHDDKKTNSLSNDYVNHLLVDKAGKVWLATAEHTNRYDPITQRFEKFPYLPAKETPTDYPPFNPKKKDFIAGSEGFAIEESPDGKIYIGTNEKLNIYDPKDRTFTHQFNDERIAKLPGKTYNSLYLDSKQNLWVGSGVVGAYKISADLRKVTVYRHRDDDPNSLPDDGVMTFAEDKQGNIWMGTDEGLAHLDQRTQRFTNYFKKDGLPFNGCSILRIVGDTLWIGTNYGMACMNLLTHKITAFDKADGLRTLEFDTDSHTQDALTGEVYMGTTRGVTYFNPHRVQQNKFVPPIMITAFNAAGKQLLSENRASDEPIVLNYDQNSFSFEMAALSYDHPEGNHYAYWLENFDKDWVQVGNQSFASYTNVPPGEYILHVWGSNNDDVWNTKGYSLPIIVKPPFWQTWWFRLLVVLELISWGIYLYQQRLRLIRREHETELRLAKEQQVLQEKLNQELAEKLDYQQKYEIAQKHQTEVEKKTLLLEREKAMAKYQNLVNQLNPHFLFNSLAVLDSLIFKEQKLASKYLRQLTKVYRYLIENDENEVVTMEQELRFAKDFIALLHTRYGEGLVVTIEIPPALGQCKIVPVTLQNLIENAIKHNTTDVESPLQIRVFVENDYLVVENNLQKRPFVATSNKKGLADFQTLYSYLTDKTVTIRDNGSTFSVLVPLLN